MTVLASETIRGNLGIDSLERAIAYSASLLRLANRIASTEEADISELVRFTISFGSAIIGVGEDAYSDITASLSIEATLFYDPLIVLPASGNISAGIIPYSDVDPGTWNTESLPPSSPSYPVIYPASSLEAFFYLVILDFYFELLMLSPPRLDLISWQWLDSADVPQVKLTVSLPLDYRTYLESEDLLLSLIPVVDPTSGDGNITPAGNFIDNGFLINNSILIEN